MEEMKGTPTTQSAPAQTGAPVPPMPTPTEQQSKKGTKAFLIIFLLVLALITAVMFFLMGNNRNSAQPQTPVMTIPTQAPSPTTSGSAEEQEVEEVDVTDTAPTDFPPVENDVKGL